MKDSWEVCALVYFVWYAAILYSLILSSVKKDPTLTFSFEKLTHYSESIENWHNVHYPRMSKRAKNLIFTKGQILLDHVKLFELFVIGDSLSVVVA